MSKINVNLLVLNESVTGKPPLGNPYMRECIRVTLGAAGVPSGSYEVSLYLIDDSEMRRLNFEHRGLRRTTDVLSFQQFQSLDLITPGPDGVVLLGDIAISMGTLARRCNNRGDDPGREMVKLLVHGVLHLIGFEHASDTARREMRQMEDGIIDTISGCGL